MRSRTKGSRVARAFDHRSGLLLATLVLARVAVAGCDDDARAKIGVPCSNGCGSATCGPQGVCTTSCTDDADCATSAGQYVCGTLADGTSACLGACGSPYAAGPVACVDGRPIACELALPTQCERCGCAEGMRCDVGVGCTPKQEVGAACTDDLDCLSGSCSPYSHVCRVAFGERCTGDDCDECLETEGWSYCTRPCQSYTQCGVGGSCIHHPETGETHCHPACDATCPAACANDVHANYVNTYCACPQCAITASRPLGAACTRDTMCDSNDCQDLETCSGFDDCDITGFCSRTCTNDGECGASMRCATTCAGSSCQTRCLPTCDAASCSVGTCRSLQVAAGGTALVCDLRADAGYRCSDPDDCVSGYCGIGSCNARGTVPVGGTCNSDGACASARCISFKCVALRSLGEVCYAPQECASGICCGKATPEARCATSC